MRGEFAALHRQAMRLIAACAVSASLLLLGGCGETAKLAVDAGVGPNPALPPPRRTLIPTVKIAEPRPWQGDEKPVAASNLAVNAFARGLDHPRWIHVLPNGDVLVAESNKPARHDEKPSLKLQIMKLFMKRAGAGTPSADRITLLRDADGDGVAETRSVFLEKLYSPFGMALVGETLFVANTDAIVQFPYRSGETRIDSAAGRKLVDLPAGELNHHWTKNIIANPSGTHLYATVGSNSNVGENGLEAEQGRAAIWEIEIATGKHRLYASGLRNPNGMAWEPASGMLWTVVNERDEIGSDLVPDYLTSVREDGFYGWPWSYFGNRVDERVKPPRPDLVARAIVPDYGLGAHTASLGLAHSAGAQLGEVYASGMFIGQHGSWNRNPPSGYKVIFVPFGPTGQPAGMPRDVLTGFLTADDVAHGRPVGVAVHTSGALLVADDVGNVIWRVVGTR